MCDFMPLFKTLQYIGINEGKYSIILKINFPLYKSYSN